MDDSSLYSNVEKKNASFGAMDVYDIGRLRRGSYGSPVMDSVGLPPLKQEKMGEEDSVFLCKLETSDPSILATLVQIDSLVKDLEKKDTAVNEDALFVAASEGNAEAVRRLLEAGRLRPDDARDAEGSTPLHVAAAAGHHRVVTTLVLLADKDEDKRKGKGGGCCCDCLNDDGLLLLVNATDRRHRTALHRAATAGHATVALCLLIGGARLDLKDCDGDTPLLAAAKAGQWSVVELLAEKGALSLPLMSSGRGMSKLSEAAAPYSFLDARDRDGNSALVHAAAAGQWSVVQVLLQRGASPTAYQSPNRAPLALAARAGRRDVAQELMQRGATPRCVKEAARLYGVIKAEVNTGCSWERRLRRAAEQGYEELLVRALAAGCDVNASSARGHTALHFAAHFGHARCAAFLVRHGAHKDARDAEGGTPLHYAAFQGHEATARVLLCLGALPDAADRNGCTALHWASHNGHARVVEVLLRHGASTDRQDSMSRTALHDAAQRGHGEIVVALLQAGADTTVQNKDHQTAAMVARTEDLKQLLKMYDSKRCNQG